MRETSLNSELKKKIKDILRVIGKFNYSQVRCDTDIVGTGEKVLQHSGVAG